MRPQLINFTGLTNNLSRQPYNKVTTIKKICENSNSHIAGKMPQDITKRVVEANDTPSIVIKKLYEDFATCANTLSEYYFFLGEWAKNYKIENHLKELKKAQLYPNKIYYRNFTENTFLSNDEVTKKGEKVRKIAKERLSKACKEAGVIPQDGKIEIYGIGQGSFGLAFQICFLDSNNQKIIHDKVMKIFPKTKEEQDSFKELKAAKIALFSTLSCDDAELTDEDYEDFKKRVFKKIESPRDCYEKILRGIRPDIDEEDIHGFLPETNRGLYLSKQIGNSILSSNIIPFYYSDFKNNFFITEMSDRNLPPIKNRPRITSFGLENTDRNMFNTVNNRLIDYGGLQIARVSKPSKNHNPINLSDSSSW